MGKIRWTERSISNLENIHSYFSQDSPVFASQFIKTLISETIILESFPKCGRIVPEIQQYRFRELIRKGYRIVYRLLQGTQDVEVLAIVHSSQDFKPDLLEK